MPEFANIRRLLNTGDRALIDQTTHALAGCESVLDVGCGVESVLERLPRMAHSVGFDGHAPAIEASRARGVHDEYVHGDATNLPFEPSSFDAVIAFDLIEHLTKDDGVRLLAALEAIARKVVVVFTPNGEVEQDEYAGNPLQVHLSGCTPADFARAGYSTRGMKGLRVLRGRHSEPRPPQLLTRLALSASQPVVQSRPRHAYSLLAIKASARA